MDLDSWLLFATVGLMLANRALHLGEQWYRRKALFWTIQLLNFTGACLLVTLGIPGFTGVLRIVNLMLAGLLVLHTVQNNRHYLLAWQEAETLPAEEREARRAEVLAHLRGAEEDPEKPLVP